MDIKTTFLDGDLKDVYMTQPEGFVVEGKGHLVCRLKKFIYGLKQALRQWYLKFDKIIRTLVLQKMLWTTEIMSSLKAVGSQY
jgi:hypothetical protein